MENDQITAKEAFPTLRSQNTPFAGMLQVIPNIQTVGMPLPHRLGNGHITPSLRDTRPLLEVTPAALEQNDLIPTPPPQHVIIGKTGMSWTESISRYERHNRASTFILTALVLLLVTTIVSYMVLSINAQSPIGSLTVLQPKPTASVTITPFRKSAMRTYTIAIVTGQPDSKQEQVSGARTISDRESQSLQVNATGKNTLPATSASGTLTFSNATQTVTIPAGTSFRGRNNITLIINTSVRLLKNGLAVTVGSHANPAGSKGNVPAHYINGNNCYPNCSIGSIFHVQNTAAFAGGHDPQSYVFVQQSDINIAAGRLEASLASTSQAAVKSQIKTDEQTYGSIRCSSSISSSQNAGARVPNIAVSGTENCSAEVYSTQEAQALAVQLLRMDVTTLIGASYVITGDVTAQVSTQPKQINPQGMLSINIAANGTASYQITTTEEDAFAKLIAGKSPADAPALLLKQTGVALATINISGNSTVKLPTDPDQITFEVAS